MLFTIFSDLHIHNYKKFDVNSSRLQNTLNVLNDVFSFSFKNGIKHIVFVGDLYDSQKALPTIVINETIKRFKQCFNDYPGIDFIAISGNHDYSTKNTIDVPGISALDHLNNIFDRFLLIDRNNFSCNNVCFHGVPFFDHKEHFEQYVKQIDISKTSKNFLLIHQTPSNISNTFIPHDILCTSEIFEKFDFVFCGHIHKHEILTKKFMVVGSPIHRDLGDIGENKGFIVFDSDSFTSKFLELKKYPKFIRVDSEDDSNEDNYSVINLPIIEKNSKFDFNNFSTNLLPIDLVTNYWKECDGKDKSKLEIGLSFLK